MKNRENRRDVLLKYGAGNESAQYQEHQRNQLK
jgi:hypothetical protein